MIYPIAQPRSATQQSEKWLRVEVFPKVEDNSNLEDLFSNTDPTLALPSEDNQR